MSLVEETFVGAFDPLFSEIKTNSSLSWVTNGSLFSKIKTVTTDWRSRAVEAGGKLNVPILTDNVTQLTDATDTANHWIAEVSRKTVQFVHNVTGNSVSPSNDVVPEVTINRPEVYESVGFGTAEKVVVGAAVVVAILAAAAILLRLCRPACRSKILADKDSIESSFGIEVTDSKLSGYTNLEVASNSSTGTESSQSNDWSQSGGSNPSTDWSDLSSDGQKSFDSSQSESEMPKKDRQSARPMIPGVHGSSHLQSAASEERLSAKSSPLPQRQMNDEVLSVISTHSLEPVRFEQAYRNRWDDQWDPYGSLPRGNLSYHSHPSESRLSLNSYSSHSSSMIFPIPSREAVKQLNSDKSNRYPSNLRMPTAARKEKHVRMSPPSNH